MKDLFDVVKPAREGIAAGAVLLRGKALPLEGDIPTALTSQKRPILSQLSFSTLKSLHQLD